MIAVAPYPFLRLSVFFMAGIVAYLHLPSVFQYSKLFVLVLGIAYLLLYFFARIAKELVLGIVAFLFVFFGGAWICERNTPILDVRHFSHFAQDATAYIGVIDDEIVAKPRSSSTYMRVKAIHKQGKWLETNGKVLVYFPARTSDANLKYGDYFLIKGKPQEVECPKNPGEFDFKKHLSFKGIYHRHFLYQGQWAWLKNEPPSLLWKYAFIYREIFSRFLRNAMGNNQEFAVASMLILGIRQSLDTELLEAYSAAGAIHVLAVSGMHVGLIFSLLQSLLGILRKNRKLAHLYYALAFLAIWFFGAITAFSPSVLRAVVMCSVVLIGEWVGKKGNLYNTLGFTAFILLFFSPYMILNVGFQLSFMAVLGIVFFQPKIASLLQPKWKLAKWTWDITTISMAAQLTTFPLVLFYFHQFPIYFLVANLWVIWASSLILYVGILFFAVSFWPTCQMLFGLILKNAVAGLNASMYYVLHLPGSVVSTLSFDTWEIVTLYLILLLFVLLIKLKDKRFLLACLVLATCFSCSRIWKSKHTMSRHLLLVCSLKKGVCIVIVKARTAHIWHSYSLGQNQSAMHFQVIEPLKTRGIHKFYFIKLPKDQFEWKYGATKILVLQNPPHSTNKINSNNGYDIVYVTYPCAKKEDLLQFTNAKHLILQSKKCIRASGKMSNIWDLSNRAFEIDLICNGKYTDRSKG